MSTMSTTNTKLIIVDISSFIFRAFYAIHPLHSPQGVPVNAVHGILSMLLKLFETHRPSHILIARDSPGPSFRHTLYPDYKANRSDPPEELVPQFDLIAELMEKMQLPTLISPQYEADDLIGSACVQWRDHFPEILIATSDKDLMQFVDDKIKILDTMKDKIYDRQSVFDKLGVWPKQVVDYLSMLGDSSDNIPGMKGIGAKGAAKLLGEYQTLEGCIKNSPHLTNKRLHTAFADYLPDGLLSQKLILIPTHLDLTYSPEQTQFTFRPSAELITFLTQLGFKALLKKVTTIKANQTPGPQTPPAQETSPDNPNPHYHLITPDTFSPFFSQLQATAQIAIAPCFPPQGYLQEITSLAIHLKDQVCYYLPLSHSSHPNLSPKQGQQLLQETVGNPHKTLVGSQLKKLFAYCHFHHQAINCQHFDPLVANYLTASVPHSQTQSLAQHFLDHPTHYPVENSPEKNDPTPLSLINTACEAATLSHQLKPHLEQALAQKGLTQLYQDMENPLTPILALMESNGVQLNQGFLCQLESHYTTLLEEIQEMIAKESGENINLNSPKQVAALLFDKLRLPTIKKIKTGFSTDVAVLTELAARNLSPIPELLIRYRELEKLLSTYIKVLPTLIHPQSKRVHTHFNQTVAATGRLSSDRPNLQNIPIRTEYGKKIRQAFIAQPGSLLLSADYSQVELRLLAHLSSDPTMIQAFRQDRDIHAQTASEVTGIALSEISPQQRSRAKAVNFGLMYGQSSFGLAKSLGISRQEAKDYIVNYFERFAKVKSYLDKLKDECAKTGYAITHYGRKRFLPDIESKNRTIRSNAERMAINSPIQGTAADIIKMAMITLAQEMKQRELQSKMILQVHDELIFEVPQAELTTMRQLVPQHMEGVAEFQVPLKVDLGIGVNWYDLK